MLEINPHLPAIKEKPMPQRQVLNAIAIKENNEMLVELPKHPRLFSLPAYYQQQIKGAQPNCYLRQTLVEKLLAVIAALPKSLGLVIFDGWRSTEVQTQLYQAAQQTLRQQHPEWDEKTLQEKTAYFVSVPSKDRRCPSPHLTGGSVDLSLCDLDGNPLPMGTAFDEMSEQSYTHAFEKIKGKDRIKQHRRVLYHAMADQGFSNLPSEWWHYDYGNQLWAYYRNQPMALYQGTQP